MGITKKAIKGFDDLYDYYNECLFKSQLPYTIVQILPNQKVLNKVIPGKCTNVANDRNADYKIQFSLSALKMKDVSLHALLVHNMTHIYQSSFGNVPVASGYHNIEWSKKMQEIGLMPTTTGKIGGKNIGPYVTQYAIKNGPFDKAFHQIENKCGVFKENLKHIKKNLVTSEHYRYSYQCDCNHTIAAKAGLNIVCLDCQQRFVIKQFPTPSPK